MSRVGLYFESVVRRIIERGMGLEKGKVEYLIVGDIEIDAYVHDKMHIPYEVKSRATKSDAVHFFKDATEVEEKLGITAKKGNNMLFDGRRVYALPRKTRYKGDHAA
jgi:hypothetical protein